MPGTEDTGPDLAQPGAVSPQAPKLQVPIAPAAKVAAPRARDDWSAEGGTAGTQATGGPRGFAGAGSRGTDCGVD